MELRAHCLRNRIPEGSLPDRILPRNVECMANGLLSACNTGSRCDASRGDRARAMSEGGRVGLYDRARITRARACAHKLAFAPASTFTRSVVEPARAAARTATRSFSGQQRIR